MKSRSLLCRLCMNGTLLLDATPKTSMYSPLTIKHLSQRDFGACVPAHYKLVSSVFRQEKAAYCFTSASVVTRLEIIRFLRRSQGESSGL
jgi:hypothetical protein